MVRAGAVRKAVPPGPAAACCRSIPVAVAVVVSTNGIVLATGCLGPLSVLIGVSNTRVPWGMFHLGAVRARARQGAAALWGGLSIGEGQPGPPGRLVVRPLGARALFH